MIRFNGKYSRKKGQTAKFGNVPTVCKKGHSHGSKLEGAVCDIIGLRELAGELRLEQIQATVYLSEARYRYIPDFRCTDLRTDTPLYIEAKGKANQRWPTTKKLWGKFGPAPLEIWMGSYRDPQLAQTITPTVQEICTRCGK